MGMHAICRRAYSVHQFGVAVARPEGDKLAAAHGNMHRTIKILAYLANLSSGNPMKFAALHEPTDLATEIAPLSPELAAARAPIDQYLLGHATGQASHMRAAFHPDAKIVSFRDGALHALSVDEFCARFQGQPAADEAQRTRRIEFFDKTGNAATAKVVLAYPEVTFTDYMVLLQIDGEWKITNKTFSAAPVPV